MTDREFLIWNHERLTFVHKESSLFDYMHKLRAIVRATPADRETPNVALENDLGGLVKRLPGPLTIYERLITCADNGYDTAELHDIVADARKAVGR